MDTGKQSDGKVRTVPLWKLYSFTSSSSDKILICVMLVSSMIVGLAHPINIFVYNNVVNILVRNPMKNMTMSFSDLLRPYVGRFALNALVTFLAGYAQISCTMIISERYGRLLKLKFFSALIYQDVGWYDSQETGRLITHISDDIPNIEAALTDKMGQFVLELTKFIGNLVLAFSADVKLSLVGLSSMPFVFLVFGFILPFVSKYSKLESDAYNIAGNIAMECFHNIKTIIAYNAQRKCVERFASNLKLPEVYHMKKTLFLSLAIGLVMFIVFAVAGLVFYVGLIFYKNGKMEPGGIMIVIFSIVIGCISFGTAIPLWEAISNAQRVAVPIFDIIDRDPPIKYNNGVKPSDFSGDLFFKNVFFSYPTRPSVKILNNLTIKIPQGKMVAFVGPSGSGKSTIIQLLLRYYNPNRGEIFLGRDSLTNVDLKWYRSNLALVQQEPNLFSWTISENIRLGKLDATQNEIVEATKLSSAYSFISKAKDGFDTTVGEKGAGFSGGQKQRIAIATALIRRDAKMLLLDEATSALDNISERLVQESIDRITKESPITIIVVAHKLATISKADVIVVMKQGQIFEIGNHSKLMSKKGLYYSMVLKQKGPVQTRDITITTPAPDLPGKIRRETVSSARKSKQTTMQSLKTSVRKTVSKSVRQPPPPVDIDPINAYNAVRKSAGSFPSTMDYFFLLKLSMVDGPFMGLGFISALILGLVFPISSLVYAEIYKVFQQKLTDPQLFESNRVLYPCILILPATILLLCQLGKDYGFGKVKGTLTSRLRKMFLNCVLSQEVGWLDQPDNHSGVLTARLAAEVSNASDALTVQTSVCMEAFINLFGAIAIAFMCNWQLSLLFMMLVPMLSISGFLQAEAESSSGKSVVKSGAFVTEAMGNIKMINTYNLQDHFYMLFENILKQGSKVGKIMFIGFFGGIGLASFYFAYALIFYAGGKMLDRKTIEVINLMRVFSCLSLSATALSRAVAAAPDIGRARKAARRTIDTLLRKPLIDSTGSTGIVPKERLTGRIEFRNVYFCYPTRPSLPILLNVSFRHDAGKSLALVGQSGCGKSTILQLLQRFYDPIEVGVQGRHIRGSVMFDDYDMADLNLAWVRNQIGVVSQEANLFNMSVIDNIVLSSGDPTKVNYYEALECAKKADIHKFVSQLPRKYDTCIGEGGRSLSGGQRQRISIARALYKNPTILILDEATSALDTESEQAVTESLKELQAKYTSVQIAHRLRIIKDSNLILVLDAGEVVEQGTHDDLLRMRGYYYQLQQNAMDPTH